MISVLKSTPVNKGFLTWPINPGTRPSRSILFIKSKICLLWIQVNKYKQNYNMAYDWLQLYCQPMKCEVYLQLSWVWMHGERILVPSSRWNIMVDWWILTFLNFLIIDVPGWNGTLQSQAKVKFVVLISSKNTNWYVFYVCLLKGNISNNNTNF